jgi:hypothetical protein
MRFEGLAGFEFDSRGLKDSNRLEALLSAISPVTPSVLRRFLGGVSERGSYGEARRGTAILVICERETSANIRTPEFDQHTSTYASACP